MFVDETGQLDNPQLTTQTYTTLLANSIDALESLGPNELEDLSAKHGFVRATLFFFLKRNFIGYNFIISDLVLHR